MCAGVPARPRSEACHLRPGPSFSAVCNVVIRIPSADVASLPWASQVFTATSAYKLQNIRKAIFTAATNKGFVAVDCNLCSLDGFFGAEDACLSVAINQRHVGTFS